VILLKNGQRRNALPVLLLNYKIISNHTHTMLFAEALEQDYS
jgi:hypothetical protein